MIHPSAKIHPTAIVADGAVIGEDVVIGPFCIIEGSVEIKARTVLNSHIVVKGMQFRKLPTHRFWFGDSEISLRFFQMRQENDFFPFSLYDRRI